MVRSFIDKIRLKYTDCLLISVFSLAHCFISFCFILDYKNILYYCILSLLLLLLLLTFLKNNDISRFLKVHFKLLFKLTSNNFTLLNCRIKSICQNIHIPTFHPLCCYYLTCFYTQCKYIIYF